MHAIDFYFDLISPFAHVALGRLGELPPGVTLRPRPILLGPVLAHWGQRGPAEIAPKRAFTYRMACFLGERYGVPTRFPPRHPFNPLGAMRLLAGTQADVETVRRAFAFVFGEGRAPDTPEELGALAQRLGMDASAATTQDAKDRLRANTEEAIARGVFGVPTFVAQGEYGDVSFWGVDGFDMLLAWLSEDGMFGREPYASLDSVETGVVRKAAAGG